MRILVCGGRDFTDEGWILRALEGIEEIFDRDITTVIEGGASGADRAGRHWAELQGRLVETFEADWEQHGRSAGPIRNKLMLIEGKPDLVLAMPGGAGTANMIKMARAADIPIIEVKAIE